VDVPGVGSPARIGIGKTEVPRQETERSTLMSTPKSDLGLVGLAVMGQNLVLNMEDHGYRVTVFNRTVSKVDEFVSKNPGEDHRRALR
jgi:glutamyl-tRNA reductase